MAKGEIRVIRVPKGVTLTLLVALSLTMVALIYALSGRAYVQERASIAQIVAMVRRGGEGEPVALLATMAPLIADILFFLPWGALAFLAIDREGRSRIRTYLLTLILGVAFALVLAAWQEILPTRVTGWIDAMWNVAGCLAGAFIGHARKQMRIRFQ